MRFCGLTTVVMVLLLGQSRIIFAMSGDGLLPRGMATVRSVVGTKPPTTATTAPTTTVIRAGVPVRLLALGALVYAG